MNIENSRRVLLGAAAVVVAIILAVYFFSRGGGGSKPAPTVAAVPAGTPPPPAAPASESPPQTAAAVPAGPTAPDAATLTVPELLNNAAKALSEQRLVEPQGNNAVEYYLLVLERDKDNRSAQDGLREMFPLATGAVEQQINAGQTDASLRMINLLGKADPTNYTLTILRNKLDLKKRQVERDQQKRDQDKRDQDKLLATARNQPAATAPAPGAATPVTAAAANAAPTPAAGASPAPAQNSTAQTAVALPAAAAASLNPAALAAGGENRAAALVTKTAPNYPPDAARKHEEGWVEVGFTVGADGHVKDAAVIGASPARVFNESALRAIASWTFTPRLENGKPVEEHIRSRIEFKL